MNEFEKRFNALRLQYKAMQRQITKEAYKTIGRLNNAIGQVGSPEACDALRSEKDRVCQAMRESHLYNKKCYLQKVEQLYEEQMIYFQQNPSNRTLRSLMSKIYKQAQSKGQNPFSIAFGDNHRAEVSFS